MEKVNANKKSCLQPMPKILVSCRGADGRNNALAVAYCGNCSYDPPMVMVGIVPSRFSYHMIEETKCFVVNLVGPGQKEIFDYLGSHSGSQEDKLAKCGAAVVNGEKVNAPILADCPVNIECTVVDSIMTGSHKMYVGKIEAVHCDKSYVKANGDIDFSKIELIK
jgi:flavin reductase (DIM6/NTAB) family NADH-FMN oxidoreductase RutF